MAYNDVNGELRSLYPSLVHLCYTAATATDDGLRCANNMKRSIYGMEWPLRQLLSMMV